MSSLKIHSTVLCEEVRREHTGQAILIGASNRGPNLPSDGDVKLGRLAFYIEAEVVDAESVKVRFKSADNDKVVFLEELEFPYKDSAEDIDYSTLQINLQLVVEVRDVQFSGPGRYLLEYTFDDLKWSPIREYIFPPEDDS